MKNSWIRRALAVPAALLLVSLFAAASARAQAPVDDSKTVVKTNKITDSFYTVDGRGGTIGVLVGPQGTFMVDTQFAPLTDRIVAGEERTLYMAEHAIDRSGQAAELGVRRVARWLILPRDGSVPICRMPPPKPGRATAARHPSGALGSGSFSGSARRG